jgi:hypothetical protein
MWVIVPRRIRWTGHVLSFRRKENTYRVLGGKPEGKRLFGRPRGRWQDHIKMDVMEIRWVSVEFVSRVQDRGTWGLVLKRVLNLFLL